METILLLIIIIKTTTIIIIIIIIKSTGHYSCINLYCHRWISVILDVQRNREIALELRAVLDDKFNESAMWWPEWPALSWGTLNTQYSHLLWKRWSSHYTQHWCSLISRTPCSFGFYSVRRIYMSNERPQRWQKDYRAWFVRRRGEY